MKPTIVLINGGFAESASWDGIIDPLLKAGYPVIAAANSLRGLAADAEAVSDLVRAVDGPVLLVAHSYGGAVMSNVDADAGDIIGLVYLNAFAPDRGESCFSLAALFPGSTLGDALPVTQKALTEPSGDRPLWRELPSWFLIGGRDKNIPAALQRYMAERAHAHRVVELPFVGHPIAVSAPDSALDLILKAAAAALYMAA